MTPEEAVSKEKTPEQIAERLFHEWSQQPNYELMNECMATDLVTRIAAAIRSAKPRSECPTCRSPALLVYECSNNKCIEGANWSKGSDVDEFCRTLIKNRTPSEKEISEQAIKATNVIERPDHEQANAECYRYVEGVRWALERLKK